jgi:hypothetical protein
MLYASADYERRRFAAAAKLHQLIGVSEAMLADAALAREIKRTFA